MNAQPRPALDPSPHPVVSLWQGWNRFWFSPADPTPLGVIRLIAGLILFYIHFAYTYDLAEFVGPRGWADLDSINEYRRSAPQVPRSWDWQELGQVPDLKPAESEAEAAFMQKWNVRPRQAVAQGYGVFSVWFHVTDPSWVLPVHVGMLVIFFLFAVGFCTRVTSALAWLACLSYIQRSPISL